MTSLDYRDHRTTKLAIFVIAIVVCLAGLKLAGDLMAPVVLGLVGGVVLGPIVTRLSRIGVPRTVSASTALFLSLAFLVLFLSALGPVLSGLMEEVPKIQREVREWLEQAISLVRGVDDIGREIEETLENGGEEAVKAAMPSIVDALWMAPNFAAQSMIFAGTLFFFVMTANEIYEKFPHYGQRLRLADRAVSYYFVTVTLINATLGLAVFGAMTVIGMPNAMLWGGAAFLLNFVLYLGPVIMLGSLLVAAVMNFSGAYILLPPLSYLALNMIEAQFLTPTFVGQRLRLNPLLVFLSILFGLWLWGPVGGVVSLPVLVWGMVFLGHQTDDDANPDAKPVEPQASVVR